MRKLWAVLAAVVLLTGCAAQTAASGPARWKVLYADHHPDYSTLLTGIEIMQVDDICLLITYRNGDHQPLVVDQKYCHK